MIQNLISVSGHPDIKNGGNEMNDNKLDKVVFGFCIVVWVLFLIVMYGGF